MRLIDADKLAEDIYRAWTLWEKKGKDCYLFAEVITPMLIGQPAVDAGPVRHGHWEDKYGDGNWHCSMCGAIVEKDEQNRHNWNRCYHCGAKMDEVTK